MPLYPDFEPEICVFKQESCYLFTVLNTPNIEREI